MNQDEVQTDLKFVNSKQLFAKNSQINSILKYKELKKKIMKLVSKCQKEYG